MNYKEALSYIENTNRFGRVLGLANITRLLELLGNPQEELKIIHVAGTNGKGSTSSFISSMLISGGYKVGLFTSPYLETFTERIRINGINIPEEDLGKATEILKEKVDIMLSEGFNHPTEFEIVTAIAFLYYMQQGVDYVVLEVGLGGRFDATNVISNPLVCVITPISMDHIDYLGDTLPKIAFEKAGIIKENSQVVIYPQDKSVEEVIKDVAKENNATLTTSNIEKEILTTSISGQSFNCKVWDEEYENVKIGLIGDHQINNAIVAMNVMKVLKENHKINIDKKAIYEGLEKTKWPGRIELLNENPLLIIDGAHNEDGANSLKEAIDKYFSHKKITLVVGMLKDKDVDAVLKLLVPKCEKIITTRPDSDRALSAEELSEKVSLLNKDSKAVGSIKEAVNYAIDTYEDGEVIIFAGSLYMIGEVRAYITKELFKNKK